MPPRWMAKHEVCEKGWGCQETLILVDNGPQVYIVFNKGCTPVVDQDARITEHRAGPGLSVLSYTHVCRHQDNCNNLSTTLPLWTPPSIIGPGSLRCPVCLSIDDCKSAKELTCPAGSTHCYQGSIQFRGGGIFTILRVQGCMSQAGCNMLKGTREIGSIVVREDCSPKASLICEKGVNTYRSRGLSQMPINWNSTTNKICDPEEVCQETVLLVDAGQSSIIVGSKDCTKGRMQDGSTVSIYSGPPGVLVASYAHFCSSNRCNRARNTSVLLNSLPHPGGVSSKIYIQGCMTQASSSLLNRTQKIGIFSVAENSEEPFEPLLQDRAVSTPFLAWVVGLGLSLALWCGMPLS
ncbi:ly6/PLAUR domain-containing protein 3 isoform X2 [Hyaena hyaena]|uniref:ly6/PLAUR domain-containing protein 3 isoform X2 n=1 Tax=Hyaena hyaena TaxID=95912 RepID=UPI001923C33A|nr:ly6/PLAUR domain-containing protein 3 isoform X2 [Hyaena hyaena]